MSGKDYKVHKVYLKKAECEVLILQIPEVEIEDKLTYLASEKGQISKSLFEDFLFATCIANINQFLFHINQTVNNPKLLLSLRSELMDEILVKNPMLDPKKLLINKNYVVKRKEGRLKKGEKNLVDNNSWGISYYDELADVRKVLDNKQPKQPQPPEEKKADPNFIRKVKNKSKDTKTFKDINMLDYEVVQRWWKRIGQYIKIREYSPEDIEHIFKRRYFHNRASFETFIVSVCVEEFEELFSMLDEIGIPRRIAPPILMHELYELCRECNEFLTFSNSQALSEPEATDDQDQNPRQGPMRGASATPGGMKQFLKKTPKRLFKDVPKEDVLKIGDNMKIFLIGQNEAVDNIAESIQRASVGLKDPNKPIGSFLFAGRTGVGKTLATKVLADELIKGSKDNIVNIDCSEYTADHEYSKLIGAPSGYVGHEHGGFLTNAVSKNPFSVIVFDEIEKASHKVHQLLLQILEEGRLTDGKGKTVSFSDSIVVMTSNVGVKEIESVQKTIGFGDAAKLTEKKKNQALTQALKAKFKPEFLNRIDSIVNFRNLTKKDYMRIIDIELYRLNDHLRSNDSEFKGLELKFDKRIKEYIYKNGINDEYGARPLKRCIEREISTSLAKELLSNEEVDKEGAVLISAFRGKVKFHPTKKLDNPPFYMSNQYGDLMTRSVSGEE